MAIAHSNLSQQPLESMATEKSKSLTTLVKLFSIDMAAAASSSFAVSPMIAIVDRSIIENTNGKTPLVQGLKQGFAAFVASPHRFITTRQFRLVFAIYFSTYMTANVIDTTSEFYQREPTETAAAKFVGTTAVNMTACIIKDRAFTRMFGTVASKPLPLFSYLLFASRDSLTILSSFNAPPIVSKYIQTEGILNSSKMSDTIAQLACPAVMQFISTPLHLLGLDLYNNSNSSSGQRLSLIRREYVKSVLARVARIAPAFGIGGVGNNYVRSYRQQFLPNP
ncbi:hypothetical protein INT43_004493 [Umbelopsis isabellina]|uniref:Sequence orphan n=1 Tax=Mortierella isabellina TaxID=91625 RepID=A0A8H7U8D9_MORIS|nr:hypothetical protein INT43_004493 [Umbelopsis isabellina]